MFCRYRSKFLYGYFSNKVRSNGFKNYFIIDQTNLKIAQTVKDNTKKKKSKKLCILDSLVS